MKFIARTTEIISSSIDGTGDLTFFWNDHGNSNTMQMENLRARFAGRTPSGKVAMTSTALTYIS
ncbi:hypothetical protein SADUNF_Sadunf01G0024400 [Salix dunnii]|uniref:Uncharacterized protein n=1 Tax=Salix dunnii TaxID=1413687 RepID=A0A835TKX3_9ROSI|nr:hypothetical protein SADUNF_Sadunf01G0024400 [Salix dunnii]